MIFVRGDNKEYITGTITNTNFHTPMQENNRNIHPAFVITIVVSFACHFYNYLYAVFLMRQVHIG